MKVIHRWKTIAYIAILSSILLYAAKRYSFYRAENMDHDWFEFIHDYLHETKYFYNGIENSGLEAILPPSARDIQVKWNGDYNTMIVSFTYDVDVDYAWRLNLSLMSRAEISDINPKWALRERWFPEDVRLGDWNKAWDRGFRIYTADFRLSPFSGSWFFALQQDSTNAYAWYYGSQRQVGGKKGRSEPTPD